MKELFSTVYVFRIYGTIYAGLNLPRTSARFLVRSQIEVFAGCSVKSTMPINTLVAACNAQILSRDKYF